MNARSLIRVSCPSILVAGGLFACSGAEGMSDADMQQVADVPGAAGMQSVMVNGSGGVDLGVQPMAGSPSTVPPAVGAPAGSMGGQNAAAGAAAMGGSMAQLAMGGAPVAAVGGVAAGGFSAGGAGGEGDMGGASVGGSSGAPDDGLGPFGPTACLPAFQEVCGPDINFENQDPANSGNFDAVMTDVEGAMKDAACTVCSILYRTPDDLPRTHDTINFIIDNHDGVAYAGGNSIHLSTNHIKNYGNPASALVEFKGVMVHETTHLYQRNGGASDGALIEGVADFVRVRAGLYGPGRCGGGDNWDGAYTISGCFFSWLAGPCDYHDQHHPQSDLDIGYRINQVIADGKGAVQSEIEMTFGTDVQSLWNQYKADY